MPIRRLRPSRRYGAAVGPIEKNVPMPRSKNYAGLRKRMQNMIPGDSFLTDASRTACYNMAQKLGFPIRVRAEGRRSIRVWRVMPELIDEETADPSGRRTYFGVVVGRA